MSFVRLRTLDHLYRELDGTTLVALGHGETLRLGPALAPLLDMLACGVQESEWLRRMADEPALAGIELALSEHRMIGRAAAPRRAAPLPAPPTAARWGALPLAVCVCLLAWMAVTTLVLRVIASQAAPPLPGGTWLLAPLAFFAVVLVHETGHWATARLCGQHAAIRLWSDGVFLPRCVIRPRSAPLSPHRRLLILAAGPSSDAAVLSASLVALNSGHAPVLAALSALCAALNLFANLRPHGHSDFNRMLALTGPVHAQPYLRGAVWTALVAGALAMLPAAAILVTDHHPSQVVTFPP